MEEHHPLAKAVLDYCKQILAHPHLLLEPSELLETLQLLVLLCKLVELVVGLVVGIR
jgi:hypothetical protein